MSNGKQWTRFLSVCAAASAAFAADAVFAQSGLRPLSGGRGSRTFSRKTAGSEAAGDSKTEVRIERFPAPGKAAMVRSPEYQVNVSGLQPQLSSRKREWALFEIKYSTGARWTDELAFTYHVMTRGKDDKGKEAFSYFTTTVRYMDIPKGPHMSCVALPPSLVERYGQPIALALEIAGRNDVLASQSEGSLREGWWKDNKIMDDKRVTRRNGLLDRSKTPFALINVNDYEVVQ